MGNIVKHKHKLIHSFQILFVQEILSYTEDRNSYFNLQDNYFNESDVYSVRGIRVPLFCDEVGFLTRPLNLTHSGIAFQSMTNTSDKVVLQYDTNPDPSYHFKITDYLYPTMTLNNTTGLYDFKFPLQVRVFARKYFDLEKCQWEEMTIVANNVSGKILNQFTHNFAQQYNDNYSLYELFEFWKGGLTHSYDKSRIDDWRSNHCHDFTWWGLQDLKNTYGVQFIENKTMPRLYGFFQANTSVQNYEPTPLDPQNPEDNQYIYQFYKKVEQFCSKFTDLQLKEMLVNGTYYHQYKLFLDEVEKREHKNITIINLANKTYLNFTSNYEPYIWYKNQEEQVPGSD